MGILPDILGLAILCNTWEANLFLPSDGTVDKLYILGMDVAELVATIDYNLTSNLEHLFFQRKVSNLAVSADVIPVFRTLSAKKAQALLEELDAWLSRHEASASDGNGDGEAKGHYASLGIYYSEHRG